MVGKLVLLSLAIFACFWTTGQAQRDADGFTLCREQKGYCTKLGDEDCIKTNGSFVPAICPEGLHCCIPSDIVLPCLYPVDPEDCKRRGGFCTSVPEETDRCLGSGGGIIEGICPGRRDCCILR